MSNYIEATMQDQQAHEVNELATRFKRMNIEVTFQPNRKLKFERCTAREEVLSHKRRMCDDGAQWERRERLKVDNGSAATFEHSMTTQLYISYILTIPYYALMFSIRSQILLLLAILPEY
ncbi:hypothetical protein BPOR_0106g00140 [Botrytis porri]|uniref:Uncharacterized protein n=1 Tax=Botrytis porri TaxID=87229 RepID=A0A4Z1KYF9_9HELO|nr:hypothetical protein BPOR_0106g00140 [Botrytis porri]